MEPDRKYRVEWPTLWVAPAWIKRHCVIPDGFRKGRPFKMYDWQLWVTLNHYRIKPSARQDKGWLGGDPDAYPILSAAFTYRRTQVIAPQKTGKGPWSATIVILEAAGPCLFYDWCADADVCGHVREDRDHCDCRGVYRCSENDCPCGWTYAYRAGEPMGMRWPTPLIQCLASSEDQVDNVWRPLRAMARGPMLRPLLRDREGFVRVVRGGHEFEEDSDRIDKVTSSAMSRLGNPIVFCLQDETQLYTETNKLVKVAETMRRGAAAMGGRSVETTNCYDPAEQSVAQRTREGKAKDVFKFYEAPPDDLKYSLKRDREKIHAHNYTGSPHADLAGINAEASELMEKDAAQAERFYGNRFVAGLGTWIEGASWQAKAVDRPMPPRGTQVVGGFDGSDVDDWTGIRLETRDGYQFTPHWSGEPMIWNPAGHGGQVPRLEVNAAIDTIFGYYDVIRFYADPPYWDSEVDAWAEKHGSDRVYRWYTRRVVQMHDAAERLVTDVAKNDSGFSHDGCQTTLDHVRNARKAPRLNQRYVLTKPGDGRKIDMSVVSVLCHEAWGDASSEKLWRRRYETILA